ncbi:ABC transporter substrate-binding protein [Treponema zioleckii]|uniref:ABC transporter substrate-binding protein n=1 Tax=Treponema zioleckii TaxID=331680 RepID=UPI00168A8497|nr:sugar ABC transporter substrate-binding protein [Treponema zioleckii]
MKKVKFLSAALLAMSLAMLTSCGNKKTSTAEVKIGSGYTTDVIKVNIWDNNQREGLQKIADEWSGKSGVKVSIEVVDWNNYWTLLEAGASGGQMPDVFWMHSNTVQMYMENDLLLNLDPYIAADSSIDMSKYYDGIKNLYTRKDGKIFAVPKDHDTIALLYNKAIFDKYGVEYPNDNWTYEDMYEAAKKITEASNGSVYGFAVDTSNNQDGWYNVVYAYGGKVITDDHKGTTLASPESKAGMEMVRKLLTVSTPQTVVSETSNDVLFKSGKVAMITQGSWMINSFYTAENAKDYAWAMLPYADLNGNGQCEKNERWSAYNGLGWAASYNTKDPNAAWGLIAYFCSQAGQREQSELGVTMAGMYGESDAFAKAFTGMDVSAFTKIEENGSLYFRPYTRNTPVWEDALKKKGSFLDAWQNPSDPAVMEKACENSQAIIKKAIAAE